MKEILRSIRYIRKKNFYPTVRIVETGHAPVVTIGSRHILMMSSNSYLGLNNHPRVVKSAIEAAKKFGVGAGSARLLSGTLRPISEPSALHPRRPPPEK